MTIKNFLFISVLQWFLFTLFKVFYFKSWLLFQGVWADVIFILGVIFLTIVLTKRLGVINFLEAIFILFFWFFLDLFSDFIITGVFTGVSIFSKWQLWVGYLAMMVCVFAFHKKRHIHIRKEQAGHHH